MVVPFWTTVLIFAGYAIQCWFIIPLLKWTSLAQFKSGLMSNRVMTQSGERYPYKEIMKEDYTLNEEAYKRIGPVYIGAHYASTIFFDYAAFVSAFVWLILFNFKLVKKGFQNTWALRKQKNGRGMSWILSDRLNVLMRQYNDIPSLWFLILFACSFVAILILTQDLFYMPTWAFIIAVVMGALAIIPMSWLYSISSFQVATGPFNTLIYGLLINKWHSGKRHPVGASAYTAIAGSTWYRAQYMLQDMKIGHFMHIAPRAVFFSQIFGEVIGIPVNYAVIHWILQTKRENLLGNVRDPTNQWTGQSFASINAMAIQYVLIGPYRLFQQTAFAPLPWGFLLGVGAPAIVYCLHRVMPRVGFDKVNTTILFSALAFFYGNVSTGYLPRFLLGFLCMFFLKKRRPIVWERYNYLVAAAFDAGFNLSLFILFLAFSAFGKVMMPNWWGNNSVSVERCFGLER